MAGFIGWGPSFAIFVGAWLVFWLCYHGIRWLLDRRRRAIGREIGLDVEAVEQPVRRGQELEALLDIATPEGLGSVEVGVVCTEYYQEDNSDADNPGRRITCKAIAHEAWQPVEVVAGAQSARFTIPAGAPFSYEGSCLSFGWELVGRGQRHGLDAEARTKLSVLP